MNRIVKGYEQYKSNHPDFAREEEEMEQKRKEWPRTIKKVTPKPVVKYKKSKAGIHYKYTLLATITGPEARALIASKETGAGCMFSYDTEKMDKVEIYHEETLH